MNRKVKLIINYILFLVESIILFSLCIITILNMTILNVNYVIKRMDKIDYYNNLANDIKTEMSYYTNQSGFEDDILDDTFTIKELKNNVNNYIIDLYKGKKNEIDSSKFEERLNNKIDKFLEDENFTITNREEIDKFTKEMSKIYVKRIKILPGFDNIISVLNKVRNISKIGTIILSIVLLILLILNKVLFKIKNTSIILFINMFLMTSLIIYLRSRIDIVNIFIYNKLLTTLIINILDNILTYILVLSVVCLLLGIVLTLSKINYKEKKD